jgi:hypothetical protein
MNTLTQPAPTSIADILLAVAAQLVSQNVVLDPSRVKIIARRTEIKHTGADRDILLWPRGSKGARYINRNAKGVLLKETFRRFSVICRQRSNIDSPWVDKDMLASTTNGLLRIEEAVIYALDDYWPTTPKGDNMVTNSLYIDETNDPMAGSEDLEWGTDPINFIVSYYPLLQQFPPPTLPLP